MDCSGVIGLRERGSLLVGTALFLLLNGIGPGLFAQESSSARPLTPLHEIRGDTDDDGVPDLLGDTVTVTGRANVATGLLHEVYLQIFIQDGLTGLSLFAESFDTPVARGDSVVATGVVQEYYGLVEVRVLSYRVFESEREVPEPIPLEEAAVDPSLYEGVLIDGRGTVVGKGTRFNGKYLEVSPSESGQTSIMVYVSNFHSRYEEFNFESISSGDVVSVTGVMSRYDPDNSGDSTFKIFLRTPGDFEPLGITRSTLIKIGIGALLLSVLAVGWVVSLKMRVSRKTRELRDALKEKEILLSEIHHRVKNNLAVMSGLIELQYDKSKNEGTRKVLRDSQSRVMSMALVHEKLYETENFSRIKMDTYLAELVEAIRSTFEESDDRIELRIDIDPVELDIDRAVPCGLLVNELTVNTFKHAFSKTEKGVLGVSLKKRDDVLELKVWDSGRGLPEDLKKEKKSSLGLMLIDTFARQLDAEIEMENRNGACFTIRFPAETE